MAMNKNLIEKLGIYGGNYGARLLGNLGDVTIQYTDKLSGGLGHPFSAIGFGIWDSIFRQNNSLKNSLANKTVKAGASLYFGTLTIKDLVDFTQGNYDGAAQLPFNASMFYTSAKDLKDLF